MKTNSFHNSTSETGILLRKFEQKAKSDENLITEWYIFHPNEGFTPYMLLDKLAGGDLLRLGSFKRAMSNLSNEYKYNPPVLTKTKIKGLSPAGRPNSFWVMSKEYKDLAFPNTFNGQTKIS